MFTLGELATKFQVSELRDIILSLLNICPSGKYIALMLLFVETLNFVLLAWSVFKVISASYYKSYKSGIKIATYSIYSILFGMNDPYQLHDHCVVAVPLQRRVVGQ